MGLFVSRRPAPAVQQQIETALRENPPANNDAAARRAAQLAAAAEVPGEVEVKWPRVVAAFAFFVALLVLAIIADNQDWISEEAKLYEYAGTLLGVLVGYLGGEAAGTASGG